MLKGVLVGTVGTEPETKYSASGSAYMSFNVASNSKIKSQTDGWVDHTEWIKVLVFGRRAEALGQFMEKGMKVYVDGQLTAKPWTDKQGNIKSGLEINATEVEVMSPRNGQGNGGYSERTKQAEPTEDSGDLSDLPW